MRKALVTAAILAASCSGQGEIIPQPSPASNPTTSAPELTSTVLAAAETTEPAPTAPLTTTTEVIEPSTTTSRYLRPVATTAPAADYSLPYDGWAIPKYIVACETGGTFSWTAYNASGASGPYQIMPEWFGGELAMNQSHAAQHAMAAKIWNGGKGASNWSACL